MLNRIYALFGLLGIQTQASRQQQRNRLVCRLWYVHNKDLSEAFRSEFYDAVIEAKKGAESYEKK